MQSSIFNAGAHHDRSESCSGAVANSEYVATIACYIQDVRAQQAAMANSPTDPIPTALQTPLTTSQVCAVGSP